MSAINSSKLVSSTYPDSFDIAEVICNCLGEPEGYLTMGTNGVELYFESNRGHFSISDIKVNEDMEYSFTVGLRCGDDWIWKQGHHDLPLVDFERWFKTFVSKGFPRGGGLSPYRWGSGICERRPVQAYLNEVNAESDDGWGDGEDLPGGSLYQDTTLTEDFNDDAEQVLTPKQLASQPSVVPAHLGKIRVVALRYKGETIAFRFKTEAGSFDMRKEVAATFGLGGFKTETFITLESVNGLLMSKLERQKKLCVPDISDRPEDCQALMNALFGE